MKAYALILALAAMTAEAKDQKYMCPEEVPATAVRIVELPRGWTGLVPERFRLRTAGVTVGYLEHRGVQLGEVHKLSHQRFKVEFPDLWGPTEEKWLTCEYGDRGIVLGLRLPDNTKRCSMLYTPDGQGRHKIDITCG